MNSIPTTLKQLQEPILSESKHYLNYTFSALKYFVSGKITCQLLPYGRHKRPALVVVSRGQTWVID